MTFRLPTEAEWEYACRAGDDSAYSFGNDARQLGEHAWFGGNSGGKTHPVGRKTPNAWGLFDMHGSVWEWCSDWYGNYPRRSMVDPAGPDGGRGRVLRGGSWNDQAGRCRAAYRLSVDPSIKNPSLGFRVARSL